MKNIFGKKNVILSVSSAASGIINGFIGTGGGIILYFVLKLLNKHGPDKNKDMKDILATIISVIIPMSVISSVIYMAKGNIIYGELLKYLPAALIGGITGAFLLDKLKFKIVKKIFAAMIIYAGVKMICS